MFHCRHVREKISKRRILHAIDTYKSCGGFICWETTCVLYLLGVEMKRDRPEVVIVQLPETEIFWRFWREWSDPIQGAAYIWFRMWSSHLYRSLLVWYLLCQYYNYPTKDHVWVGTNACQRWTYIWRRVLMCDSIREDAHLRFSRLRDGLI